MGELLVAVDVGTDQRQHRVERFQHRIAGLVAEDHRLHARVIFCGERDELASRRAHVGFGVRRAERPFWLFDFRVA